jgi:hypothetical protein
LLLALWWSFSLLTITKLGYSALLKIYNTMEIRNVVNRGSQKSGLLKVCYATVSTVPLFDSN